MKNYLEIAKLLMELALQLMSLLEQAGKFPWF